MYIFDKYFFIREEINSIFIYVIINIVFIWYVFFIFVIGFNNFIG